MNADGTCERPFTQPARTLTGPVWRPGRPPAVEPFACAELRVRVEGPVRATAPRYRLRIENDGNLEALSPSLTVTASAGRLALVRSTAGCARGARRIDCRLPPLPPGARVEIPLALSARPGRVTVAARLSAAEPDGYDANNRDSVATRVVSSRR